MFEALAGYYERKVISEHSGESPAFQVLLDFAAETDRERAELYRELLTFDYYLRENAKEPARPLPGI